MKVPPRLRRALAAMVGTAREIREKEAECREALARKGDLERRFSDQLRALDEALGERDRHGLRAHPR